MTSQQITEINTLTIKWQSLLPKDALALPNFNNASQIQSWHNNLIQWSKTYRQSFKLQTKTEQAKQITEAIIKREKAFETEKGNMIKNILEKQQDKIMLDHVIKNGEYFNDPVDVKKIAVDKARIWTRKRNMTQLLNPIWQTRYQPISHIKDDIFKSVMNPISEIEFSKTLASSPQNKAPEPSNIPSEFWKHAGKDTKLALHNLLNNCIQKEDIPKEWKNATIILIPKPKQWKGNIDIT